MPTTQWFYKIAVRLIWCARVWHWIQYNLQIFRVEGDVTREPFGDLGIGHKTLNQVSVTCTNRGSEQSYSRCHENGYCAGGITVRRMVELMMLDGIGAAVRLRGVLVFASRCLACDDVCCACFNDYRCVLLRGTVHNTPATIGILQRVLTIKGVLIEHGLATGCRRICCGHCLIT